MNPPIALALGLAGAACTAAVGTIQHQVATRGRPDRLGSRRVTDFVRHQLSQRLWWVALLVQLASLGLHASALHLGSLVLVQPLAAVVVVLALPLNHRLHRSRITPAEFFLAGAVTAGLAGFLIAAAPSATGSPLAGGRLVPPAAMVVVATAICGLLSRGAAPAKAAALLGIATGMVFSLEAILLQTTAAQFATAPWATLTDPAFYGLIITGVSGTLVAQLSYRAGPISAALPAAITVNPLASIILGTAIAGETIRTTPAALAVEIPAFLTVTVAVTLLSRFPGATASTEPHRATADDPPRTATVATTSGPPRSPHRA
jgi:hypothetical protein